MKMTHVKMHSSAEAEKSEHTINRQTSSRWCRSGLASDAVDGLRRTDREGAAAVYASDLEDLSVILA